MEKTGQRTRRIVEELRADIDFELDDVISKIVGSLPEDYFTNLSRENQLTQLKALLAMGICQLDHEIMLRSEDGRHVSVIARQNYPGLLAGILRRLPRERSLIGAKIFTSTEHDFIIDVFEFETEEVVTGTETIADQELQASIEKVSQLTGAQETKIREFVSHYRTNSPILRTPKLISEHYLAFNAMRHSNDIAIRWSDLDGGRMHVTVSTGSTRPREIFERASTFFAGKSIDIDQAFLHDIPRNEYSRSAIASFIVVGEVNNQAFRPELVEELKLFLRLDEDILSKYGFADHFDSRENAELVSAVARLVGHLMKFAGSNVPFQQVNGLARKHIHAFEKCIDAIKSIGSGKSFDRTKDLVSLEYLNNPVERKVLSTLNSIIRSLTASNISVADRRTITMRFDQQLFDEFDVNEKPFAVYYCLGQGFDGFHVRFRDVARGGMRLVRTRNDEHYLVESVRVLEEAYRLAAAQQLKNKDIAEGGAKATIILKPEIDPERAGRDFVDGLMDVVLLDSIEGASEELLYLGPDENVTPRLIEWIVKRSRMRGYPYPESLISSKPKAGINHKEFGVTSEGVTVFLKRALKYAGIDPAQSPFSVKLTGGPDGDVAGNEIKILFREYGQSVKVVGVADGMGSAIDPVGLNQMELLRLCHEERPICDFDSSKLSAEGKVLGLNTPDGLAQRNDLQFSLKSDVFIPAGGRPSTINESNWESFFASDGSPAARIVVEGANLFIDDLARRRLSDRGVIVVKDSSANKCGVICSSLEIVAGMLLTEEEFLEIKDEFVADVLELLRELAEIEANCLFNELPRAPSSSLPELSVMISQKILQIGDLIFAEIDHWSSADQDRARSLTLRYLPDALIDKLGTELIDDIPRVYRNQLVASILASRVVYREGYQNLENMQPSDLGRLALDYLRLDSETIRLIDEIDSAGIREARSIREILRHSGTRALRELGH